MSAKKDEILDGLRNWAAKQNQISRVIVFNVTSDLQPPPGRNPEVMVELIGTTLLDNSAFITLSSQLNKELVSLWRADSQILRPGQKARTEGRSDYVIAYEKV